MTRGWIAKNLISKEPSGCFTLKSRRERSEGAKERDETRYIFSHFSSARETSERVSDGQGSKAIWERAGALRSVLCGCRRAALKY